MEIRQLCLALIFIPFLQPATLSAAEFKGVNELLSVDKIDPNDPFNISIVYQRCAGLYGAFAKFLPGNLADKKEMLFNTSMTILVQATDAMAKKRAVPIDSEVIGSQVNKAFLVYVDTYYDHMENNQIKTGSMFDEFIKGELAICSVLTK